MLLAGDAQCGADACWCRIPFCALLRLMAQVLFGSFPIARCREPYSVIRYLAAHMWPRLHVVLSLRKVDEEGRPLAEDGVDGDGAWTPLGAWHTTRRARRPGAPGTWLPLLLCSFSSSLSSRLPAPPCSPGRAELCEAFAQGRALGHLPRGQLDPARRARGQVRRRAVLPAARVAWCGSWRGGRRRRHGGGAVPPNCSPLVELQGRPVDSPA